MKSARQNQVLVFYTGNGEIRTLHSDNRRADNMLRDFPEEWIGTYGPESTLDMFMDDYVSWIRG